MKVDHYVTVLDSLYLPQLLVLYRSLESVSKHCFQLWVIAVDAECANILYKLSLKRLKVISIEEIETPELLEAKSNRSRGEYCWTLTPFAPLAVFAKSQLIDQVTYIDTDIWMLKDPSILLKEFERSSKGAMLTLHGYNPLLDQSARSGKFCVQFMTFNRSAINILDWWKNKCIEWCYMVPDNDRLGDQKYLEAWPDLFEEQLYIADSRYFLAPWNAMRYPYSEGLLYHFHGCRLLSKSKIQTASYPIPPVVIQNIYKPYFKELRDAINTLQNEGYIVRSQAEKRSLVNRTKDRLSYLVRIFVTFLRNDIYNIEM